MNIEQIREIKRLGFPQDLEREPVWVKDGKEMLLIPTTEELILACGKAFTKLENAGGWVASTNSLGFGAQEAGDTPWEAMMKLWIKLNKYKP